jgi:hypothetical protein
MTHPAKTLAGLLAALPLLAGCGSTRWSDTQRTATEQFVISHAVDQAVGQLDFSFLADRKVFFDTEYLEETVHRRYLISTLRQQLLAGGCLLQEKREDADYVVEARTAVLGTDRDDVLLGVPQLNLPAVVPGVPSQVPEIPVVKRTNQVGAAKIAMFAYNRHTGRRLWQSGTLLADSTAKNLWVLGGGPFEWGTSLEGTRLAGERLQAPTFGLNRDDDDQQSRTNLVTERRSWQDFNEPTGPILPAGHNEPAKLPPADDAP